MVYNTIVLYRRKNRLKIARLDYFTYKSEKCVWYSSTTNQATIKLHNLTSGQ